MKIIFNELYAVLNRKCDNEVIDQLREEFLDKLDNIKSELFHTPLKKSARLAAGTKEKLRYFLLFLKIISYIQSTEKWSYFLSLSILIQKAKSED